MSERTDLFKQISELVDEVFGQDEKIIEEWWNTARTPLDGACPLDMLYSLPEMRTLLQYIQRINYGIYT